MSSTSLVSYFVGNKGSLFKSSILSSSSSEESDSWIKSCCCHPPLFLIAPSIFSISRLVSGSCSKEFSNVLSFYFLPECLIWSIELSSCGLMSHHGSADIFQGPDGLIELVY